jgi:hypothetical protein
MNRRRRDESRRDERVDTRKESAMKRILVSLVGVAAIALLVGAMPSVPRLVIAFHTMYGVDGPFLGEAHAIRDIPGDDLPWEVAHFANGTLSTTGHLRILVRGLVFKDADEVPEELRGINDEPVFRGVVSCLTESETGTPTANVATDGFRATRPGNADIDATVELPNPCVAPIVFVTGEDPKKWFAVTGFEREEGE